MTIEQLRALHQKVPFKPFDLHLADGRTLGVEHPELLAQSSSGRTIAVGRPDGVMETVDLLLVVSIAPRADRSLGRRKPRT